MLKFLGIERALMLTFPIAAGVAVLGLTFFVSHASGSELPIGIVPPHAVACPEGDVSTQVTIIDRFGNQIQGARVVVDLTRTMIHGFNGAPGAPCLVPCASQSLTPLAITNTSGVATFYLKAGKCCARNYEVWVGATLIGTIQEIRSLDVAGGPSLEVGLDDFALFHFFYNNVATYHGCIDFNDNGSSSDLADFEIFTAHYGHSCR